jgi:hypothetical protein
VSVSAFFSKKPQVSRKGRGSPALPCLLLDPVLR